MRVIKLTIFLLALSLNADVIIKDKYGYRFKSDRKVYFTKRQAEKVNSVLSEPKTIVIRHRTGKTKVVLNHYRVLSWKEIIEKQDEELAKLFQEKHKEL